MKRLLFLTLLLGQTSITNLSANVKLDPRGRTEDLAHRARREPTKRQQDPTIALRIPKVNIQQQWGQRQTQQAQLVQRTPTRLLGALTRPTAHATLEQRAIMGAHAHCVLRESTKQQQEPTLAAIAGKASTRQQQVRRQSQRAMIVFKASTLQQ